ncbi:hypothetical protein J6590_105760 [Homalodisca vitripennis]|nr:hypothetical protein J6590_086510 [Homalodisca vitripennis]KAG8313848.1 hypothetical protein J6590_105760 [Homalodisca vitripennis]
MVPISGSARDKTNKSGILLGLVSMELVEYSTLTTDLINNITENWNLMLPALVPKRTPYYINITSKVPIEYALPMYG